MVCRRSVTGQVDDAKKKEKNTYLRNEILTYYTLKTLKKLYYILFLTDKVVRERPRAVRGRKSPCPRGHSIPKRGGGGGAEAENKNPVVIIPTHIIRDIVYTIIKPIVIIRNIIRAFRHNNGISTKIAKSF